MSNRQYGFSITTASPQNSAYYGNSWKSATIIRRRVMISVGWWFEWLPFPARGLIATLFKKPNMRRYPRKKGLDPASIKWLVNE